MNNHLKMRCFIVFMLLSCFCCENVFSQVQKVSVNVRNASLKEVFKTIEQQTTYRFSYRNATIDNKKDISISKLNATVNVVLDEALKNRNLYYSIISSKSIVISEKINNANKKTKHITGIVRDISGDAVIGANIMIKGTNIGAITDINGHFELEVPYEGVMVVSYMGYIEQELSLKSNNSFSITLEENTQALDEVIVIGYGTQKKVDLSSSIATLSSKDIGQLPNGLETGLQSSVPGVQITNGRIRIRGVGSINDTDPLYVVDGMIGGAVPDENNIESIQILKDAASCAIYGARGANGVILINTKRGQVGKVKVEYNGYAGLKELQHTIDLLNGRELAELVNEELYNADPTRNDYMKALSNPESIGEGYNMLNALKRTGFYQKHNLSLNGGSETAHFRINGVYSSDQPTFIKEDSKSLGLQFISDFKVGNFEFGETFTIKRLNRDWSNKNVLESLQWSPTVPFYDENNPTGFMGASNGTTCGNPLAQAHLNWNKTETTLINGNAWGVWNILPGLKYKFNMGVDFYTTMTQNYDGDYVIIYCTHSPDQYDLSSIKSNRVLYENTLSYEKDFGKHNISALIGVTSEQTKRLGVNAGVRALASESVLSLGTTRDYDSRTVGSSEFESAMYSLLGRINYSYDSKYMMAINFRRDGSSNFSKKNRYGNFPSFSAAWRVSQEKFMRNLDFITDLKIRGSWGILGNSNINAYQYQSTVSFDKICYYLNNVRVAGGFPTTPSNPDVKWESQYSTDLGLDLSMFNNHLSFTFDYFYKKTKDMLVEVPISFAAGFRDVFPVLNAGSIQNKGMELMITYRNRYKKLDYSISANLSSVKNKVVELGTKNEIFASNEISKTVVGKPIGMFWGYVTDGLYTSVDQLNEDKAFAPNAQLGDVRFKDLNNDGKLNADDQDFIGNPIPKLNFGLSSNLSYRTNVGVFDLSMIWQGTYGNDIYNNTRYYGEGMFGYTNCFASTKNRYRAEELSFTNPVSGVTTIYPKNTDTDIPRAVFGDPNQNSRKSDRFVEDGKYLRLKSLVLSYSLPTNLIKKLNIEKMKFFIGGKNLLTFTGYSGFDPEVGDQNTENNLTRGIDASSTWGSTFPNIREYYMGLELVF
jgi:TonB-linked SusC/RagA family outer membrane protein